MKAASFDYIRPREVGEAASVLAQAQGGGRFLAGGQSLGPMLNLRLVRPRLLIDISRIEALRAIEERPDAWRLGAAVTHARIEDANGAMRGAAMLVEVAAGIAYRAIRNRGTIGGSLAHADPAADWPLALAALDASIEARNGAGQTRRIAADAFMKAAFTTALKEDEIIEAVVVPKLSAAARYGYFKFCRKTGEFPEASAAAVLDPERRVARIFAGALNGPPQALPGLAAAVAQGGGAAARPEAVAAALAEVAPGLDAVERRFHAAAVSRALQRVFRT